MWLYPEQTLIIYHMEGTELDTVFNIHEQHPNIILCFVMHDSTI